MSVVRRATARRWATVVASVAILAAVPPAIAALPVAEPAAAATGQQLLERARASTDVPHEGLVEVRGRLGLPNLPRLDEVTSLLDNTTRHRVWWAGPQRWRVASLSPNGEKDIAQTQMGPAIWDYDSNTLVHLVNEATVRLPRADDLLPPQAVRRLLAAVGPRDRIERIPPRRVAGQTAAGIRVVPGDERSSVTAADIWLDEASGLPLAAEITAVGYRSPVLTTSFLDVSLSTPSREDTAAVSRRRGLRSWSSSTADLASTVDRFAPWRLPGQLAGLPRVPLPGGLGGVVAYGDGLTRYVVLPLPGDVAGEAVRRARDIARPLDVPGGEAVPLHRPLLSVIIARGADREHAYLLAGTVRPEVLTQAVTELFADPPERR